MFWSRRKNIAEKNNAAGKTKVSVGSEEPNGMLKEKRSGIFRKLRKSFIKAKSVDNSDFHNTKELKGEKSSVTSLRRMLSSNKPRLVSSPAQVISECLPVKEIVKITSPVLRTAVTVGTTSPKVHLQGIVNHGNTCYINSIIQCLNSIDALVKYFVLDQYKTGLSPSKSKDNVALLLSFSSFLKSLWSKDLNCDILSNDFKSKLAITERSFRCNDQQDAQEFLLFLLNYCHETLKTSQSPISIGVGSKGPLRYNKEPKYDLPAEADKIRAQNKSIIHQLFVTHQQLTITCPGCCSRQYKLEPHLCLSLPVPAKTMEPLYYCFIEKDGSQICAAMWINTVSLVQYVRSNVAHKFRIDVNRVMIMLITESGFGKCFQDSEQAVDLLIPESNGGNQPMSNLWNGIVALEIPSAMSNSSCRDYESTMGSNNQQKSIRQMKNSNSPIRRANSSTVNGTIRHSGVYDNIKFEDHKEYDSLNSQTDNNSQNHTRRQEEQYQRTNLSYSNNFSNVSSDTAGLPINLVIIHVEEVIEKAYVSGWRRFSAPVSLLVRKEIEFNELEKMVIAQLDAVYHCNIQSKLKANLRFWVWDCLNNTDAEITSDHQFPLLTEAVESIITWSENSSIIRMVCIWSQSNAAQLMQTVFANLRLSHSLGREGSKINMVNGRNTSQSLALMDAWSSIEENGSVELVMRATLSKRSQPSDSRNVSLEDCLKAYVSEEVLDAKDAWKCPNCRKFQRATISNSIYSLPDILVLHLKRFQSYSLTFNCSDGKPGRDQEDVAMTTVGGNNTHNSHSSSLLCENNSNNKLNILVDYPHSGLDMKSYLSSDAIRNSSKKIDSSDYYYDLIAVCNHQGTLSTGHYTAFCRSSVDYKWRLFNDDIVREVLTDKVIQANAYILFYQRRSSIVCLDQHWSIILNPIATDESVSNSSPQSHKTPNTENRKQPNVNKSNGPKQTMLRKSDPPIRRAPPYQTNQISNTKPIVTSLQHSSLHRPLPLDNNCNSIRNNTPIVDDSDNDSDHRGNDSNDDDATSQGSTSYDEYIPVSVNKRPLMLQVKSQENSQLHLTNSKSH